MRKNKGKIVLSVLIFLTGIILIGSNSYSHSGRTDSNGGHKDNKNKSGLGGYHYHCGGYPAHLHTNGVCPYSSSSSSNKSSTSNSSTSNKKTTTQPSTVAVTEIQINENVDSIIVGENKKLTATIKPSNATNKNVTWKSSDESIATVSQDGEINAIKSGIVDITATSSNGKTSTIKINIKEVPKVQNSTLIKTSQTQTKTNNVATTNGDDSNDGYAIACLVILFGALGGTYWYDKKHKK